MIVAEKPSVAMSYAKVLGATSRQDGYLEGNAVSGIGVPFFAWYDNTNRT